MTTLQPIELAAAESNVVTAPHLIFYERVFGDPLREILGVIDLDVNAGINGQLIELGNRRDLSACVLYAIPVAGLASL